MTLQLQASPHRGKRTDEKVELAVVVLDEAVFDLIQDGKSYFDPYRGFYQLDELDLTNFGLLNRLVGLQKFEKKGANAGGDGGAGFDMRVVKNYVAYWNPSVATDKRGRAKVQFKLPDNLTGWRVFALAVTPGDRLGLGDYKFQSSKPTELRPVMPNQLTQGDRFTAGFSLLNRADKARDLHGHDPGHRSDCGRQAVDEADRAPRALPARHGVAAARNARCRRHSPDGNRVRLDGSRRSPAYGAGASPSLTGHGRELRHDAR